MTWVTWKIWMGACATACVVCGCEVCGAVSFLNLLGSSLPEQDEVVCCPGFACVFIFFLKNLFPPFQ